jgi:hypothetical protein
VQPPLCPSSSPAVSPHAALRAPSLLTTTYQGPSVISQSSSVQPRSMLMRRRSPDDAGAHDAVLRVAYMSQLSSFTVFPFAVVGGARQTIQAQLATYSAQRHSRRNG